VSKPVVLVTGATGFVGRALCKAEREQADFSLRAAVRGTTGLIENADPAVVGDIGAATDWTAALQGVQIVVHLAARVHVMNDTANDPLQEFRKVNTEGSLQLARQAAQAGVRRFVFVSSVKVNGESTAPGQSFGPHDVPAPRDAYGVSKREAEDGLRQIAASSGMELVIVRPPLVYGPGVAANFQRLMKLVERGAPLPFGRVDNRRSLVALDNLVDLLMRCMRHPAAPGHTFMVSDGCDLSTGELVRMMARAMNRRPVLLPVPAWLLSCSAALLGKSETAARVLGSLQVDISETRRLLEWTPIIQPQAAMAATVAHAIRGDAR
jgi:nucleoside-diphosphate-sugar epimerase